MHVLAALGVLALPVSAVSKAAVLAAVAGHACLRRPRRPPAMVRNRNGLWALPESGHTGLRLDRASRYGSWWAELRLVGAGRAFRCLLCRDQIRRRDWRLLQLELRRPAGRRDLS